MEILVVDIETAAHDPRLDDLRILDNSVITEIGVVKLDLESGRVEQLFNEVCSENKVCSPESWIFRNSSLTHDEVSSAPHLNEFKAKLQSLFDKYPTTSWWHEFDLKRLEHPSRGIKIPRKFWDPPFTLKSFLKIPFPDGTSIKRPKVTEAFRFFYPGQNLDHPHRAILDAEVEADIIYQATQRWPELRLDWQNYLISY
ncbi:MAG: hypothetical protein NWE89_17270 [Candidatus Bathyarchaeota archaeon]|nr:hypothetical protein [Candidatus Bathyarchaeota archaeon]